MMHNIGPQPVYLKDYQAPQFKIPSVDLNFAVYEKKTIVTAKLTIERIGCHREPLRLNGKGLELLEIKVDAVVLSKKRYKKSKEFLEITDVPDSFLLQTVVEIHPDMNTALDGLFKSGGNWLTQCEPHGFQCITYFLDRPDILSQFTTTICASTKYKALLANGNIVKKKRVGANRHAVTWRDPSLKPCYLFALVVGDYDCLRDKYITLSKREIALEIYVEKGHKKQCFYAMNALKMAMSWDERVFGREYDLDIYMIVAAKDFNVGAMENKGLNIFNSKYIFADANTATDDDYINIANVIAHEYFHNWSGNRVTCRDWFQLSLKEGLTVFRDQLFTEETFNSVIKRIAEVNLIRSHQFAEDSSPMAHPVQPKSYIEMNNFYTVTVYDKGAELIRMLYVLLGKKTFLRGMNIYFRDNDGKAVTIHEFIKAMEQAAKLDLKQFAKWYDVAGTPTLDIKDKYDAKNKTYSLLVKQNKKFDIPLAVGLLGPKGKELEKTTVLRLQENQQEFVFNNIAVKPIPSLLRNFSAPVKVNYSYADDDLILLMLNDTDKFNCWNAAQKLMVNEILRLTKEYSPQKPVVFTEKVFIAFRKLLLNTNIDEHLKAVMLTMPTVLYIVELMPKPLNLDALEVIYAAILQQIASSLGDDLSIYYQRSSAVYDPYNIFAIGQRKLKNVCLYYSMLNAPSATADLCVSQFKNADNMTDRLASMRALIDYNLPQKDLVLKSFYKKWHKESLVMNKWLEIQALSKLPNTLANVKDLMQDSVFNLKNPNNVFSLVRTFCKSNIFRFHDISGLGYKFLADVILELDKYNPQVAARITDPLIGWKQFDAKRGELMVEQLQRIKSRRGLSKNVYEIVNRALR